MPEPFPTMEEVEIANREQIARWHCFLAAPRSADEQDIADRIADRLLNMGGLTPGLMEKIGFAQKSAPPRVKRRAPSNVLHIADATASSVSLPRAEVKPAPRAAAVYNFIRPLKAT